MKSEFGTHRASRFQEHLLSIQITLSSLVFIGIWCLQYFRQDGNPEMVGRISFKVEDPPWMPPGQTSNPIIGFHHFGDWMLNVGWAMHNNCYQLGSYSCQQPPLGNWILRLFGIFSSNFSFAYFVWILIAVLLYINLINKMLINSSYLIKTLVFFFFVMFIPGNMISLDRGSLHFMAYALLGSAFNDYLNDKGKRGLILFTLAVSLKPQLLFASVFLLKERNYRNIYKAIATPIIANLVLMLTFPGNFLENIKGYLLASVGYVSSPNDAFGNVMNSVSWIGLFSRFYEFLYGWGASGVPLEKYSQLLMLPGILYFAVVAIIVYKKSETTLIKLILSLSLINFMVPASGGYLLGWISICVLYVLSDYGKSDLLTLTRKQSFLVLATITTLCTPGFVLYGSIIGFSRHVPLAPAWIALIPMLIASELFKKPITISQTLKTPNKS